VRPAAANCNRPAGANTVTMPLLQYFGWVGGSLVAALFAADWCCSAPIVPAPRSDVPFDQKINIRIHSDQKWPERVVFDTTRSTLAEKPDERTEIGGTDMAVQVERQPFDAFAEMAPVHISPCFRPPCSAGQVAERQTSPLPDSAPFQKRSRIAARKSFTSPNRLHKPPRRS
jgi:hypothetical protein